MTTTTPRRPATTKNGMHRPRTSIPLATWSPRIGGIWPGLTGLGIACVTCALPAGAPHPGACAPVSGLSWASPGVRGGHDTRCDLGIALTQQVDPHHGDGGLVCAWSSKKSPLVRRYRIQGDLPS